MTHVEISLPVPSGALQRHRLVGEPVRAPDGRAAFNRIAFAAAHVVADPYSSSAPGLGAALDWDATLAVRRRLLSLGLGVAEAMDTAQRGMGLDWPAALELVRRSLEDAGPRDRRRVFSGVGTDHLDPAEARSLDDVTRAYLEQLESVQRLGGRVILMASRALARVADGPDDYARVYARVLSETDQPAILHWLGDMFDPALRGYWGSKAFEPALDCALAIIRDNADSVDGIKLSLLDDGKEIQMRRRLPTGVRMYTGDDFNYPALIKGDAKGYSDALLGILDPIAPVAAAGFQALARGDMEGYDQLLAPTVPLSRHIFRAPTLHYKTGIVFLAWLNGQQDHFVMVSGAQSMRPLPYFTEIILLADAAGLLADPQLAAARMRAFLRLYGVES